MCCLVKKDINIGLHITKNPLIYLGRLNNIFMNLKCISLRWVNPLIKKGFNNELKMGDIYQWTFDSDATRLANKLEGYAM